MKKTIILAAAAIVALASCAKVAPEIALPEDSPKLEIKFQTAAYATKGATKAGETINGNVFDKDDFGTYAWSSATPENAYFMNNETISKHLVTAPSTYAWKPSTTYYWPKSATVDFISYWPRVTGDSYVTITKNSITYANFDVKTNQTDLLYADLAKGFGANVNMVADNANPESGYNGVPTLFRHALAKLSIDAQLVYDNKTQTEDNGTTTKTKWIVTLSSASLKNMYYKGGVSLVPNSTPTTGVIGWHAVANEQTVTVWTNDGNTADAQSLSVSSQKLNTTDVVSLLPSTLILPQALAADTETSYQMVSLTFQIKTYRKNNADANFTLSCDLEEPTEADLFLTESFPVDVPLYVAEQITSWEMGHEYKYKLLITPTKGTGKTPGGGNDVDPDDPYLDDVTVKFDPAIAGWEQVSASAAINI